MEAVQYDVCLECRHKGTDVCGVCKVGFLESEAKILSGKLEASMKATQGASLKIASEIRCRIRDAAVYPMVPDVKPYITIKTVDAVISKYIEEIRRVK